jgi:hypothetical protein
MTKRADPPPPTSFPDEPGAWQWSGGQQRWEPSPEAPVALLTPALSPDHSEP